ncbi:hypothetical protein GOBAR_AA31213 [Gossypium barbadense]|uniref:Uncharacterized protein n=1 Tax=Gossypium barbadense TaxID=3634 RepID=A0A2P5WEG4_GOSBA|nr:hypothetical protein GOBAR_AA31213 [Gossypium barbadense]
MKNNNGIPNVSAGVQTNKVRKNPRAYRRQKPRRKSTSLLLKPNKVNIFLKYSISIGKKLRGSNNGLEGQDMKATENQFAKDQWQSDTMLNIQECPRRTRLSIIVKFYEESKAKDLLIRLQGFLRKMADGISDAYSGTLLASDANVELNLWI